MSPLTSTTPGTIEQIVDPTFTAGDYLDVPTVRDLTNVLQQCPLDELTLMGDGLHRGGPCEP